MRRLRYILLTIFLVNTFFACENVDFDDTNANRNGAAEPTTSGLLSGAILKFATFSGRSGITIPTLLVQYQSQVTYTDEMLYAESPYSWTTYYSALNGLDEIIKLTSDEANHTPELVLQGYPANQQGVAMIMKAIIMKRVTDIYGDVPFSKALQGLGNITPAYDEQENIYKALIADVKAARDMLVTTEEAAKGDNLYYGNTDRWKKLANSLIMQMAVQLSKRFPGTNEYAATEFRGALVSGPIADVADEAWFTYEDVNGHRNPWNANRTADYFLSQEFTDAMQGFPAGAAITKYDPNDEAQKPKNTVSLNPTSNHTYDERSKVYMRFSDASDSRSSGVAYGYRNGSGAGKNSMNRDYYWNTSSPLPVMTASYTYLNRAEAAVLGWTNEDAGTMLETGILKSFETLSTHSAMSITNPDGETISGATYATARLADATDPSIGIEQVIGEEKWKSLFGQAFDAWAEWRRTGYPNLTPATDHINSGEIPRRFIYPREEASLNGANYNSAVGRLLPGEDHNTSRVWWDVE